ncbi:MAG: glycosyltransferase [Rickettsiales bacterium]|jgi:glycosyltransferase involved in cell wall biosynthesis|nr:glycosyltransferase [Rickettsiales bacterium]
MRNNTMSRTYIINQLIRENNLKSYLEIGVSNPYANYLDIVCAKKVSVDPCKACEYFSKESIEQFKPFITHQMTSDEFFADNREVFDIIFIDGDHSYSQSLKDLNNALKAVPRGGFVILHDAAPISFDATKTESFKNKQPYNGEVWKTVVSAIKSTAASKLQIGTFPYDFGVCVIKKLADDVPEIPVLRLDYHQDYSLPAIAPVCDICDFYNKKVSYFTSLYNTPASCIERTARTVLNQTNPNWEWVLVDDSSNALDAARLEKFFASLSDARIKYFRFNVQSGGFIGRAKKRAANLCSGDYLAELDHDDLLMPSLTENIISNGEGFDFIYSNCASVVVADDETMSQGERFADGFAMGYGSYRNTDAVNPLTGFAQEFNECVCAPINPKTIRHIVGIPNHIRVWAKKFYDAIGGHNPDLLVADDYDLVLRSFLAGGKFLHLDSLGYLQVEYPTRTTYARNSEIQVMSHTLAVANNERIKAEFKARNMDDWAYKYYAEKFGFGGDYYQNVPYVAGRFGLYTYHWWDVPGIPDADAANCKV